MKYFLILFNYHLSKAEYVATFNRPGDAQIAVRLFNENLSFTGIEYHTLGAKSRRAAIQEAQNMINAKTTA